MPSAAFSFFFNEVFKLVSLAPNKEYEEFGSCLPNIYSGFRGKVVFASYSGSIGIPCMQRFAPSLEQLLTPQVEQIVLSFKDVEKLSRSAVGILVDFAAGVLGRGKELYLYRPHEVIVTRLHALNVDNFFKILHTESDLISVLHVE